MGCLSRDLEEERVQALGTRGRRALREEEQPSPKYVECWRCHSKELRSQVGSQKAASKVAVSILLGNALGTMLWKRKEEKGPGQRKMNCESSSECLGQPHGEL